MNRLAKVHKERTWSMYRDEPSEHVLTVHQKESPHECHYECTICGGRLWTNNDRRVAQFLDEHDECKVCEHV